MSLYLILNMAVILFPLLFSFDRRVVFFRQWRAVFPAILLVGTFYIVEDVVATAAGSWSFAPEWVGSHRLLGLPMGEWLFFITAPYSCLFIYACVRGYVRERLMPFPRFITWVVAGAAALLAWVYRDQSYTKIVLIVFSATVLLLGTLGWYLLSSFHFWMALAISYGMFLIVNGVLTAVPVVLYNPSAIWGLRLITIPLEDVFYNFSLLTLNFMIFRLFLDGGFKNIKMPPSRRRNPADGDYVGPGGLGSITELRPAYRFMEGRTRQHRRQGPSSHTPVLFWAMGWDHIEFAVLNIVFSDDYGVVIFLTHHGQLWHGAIDYTQRALLHRQEGALDCGMVKLALKQWGRA